MNSAKAVTATFNTTTQELNAEAGPASKKGTVGTSVELDGSASTGAKTYSWTLTKPDGSDATALISGITRSKASFTPSEVGPYVATITVGNGTETDKDTITINVTAATAAVPVADAGDDRETKVNVPTSPALDGTASKNAANFNWQVTQLEPGSTPKLATPTDKTTTFTADVAGEYVVTLTVRDVNNEQPSKDTVKITVTQ
jgi:hypothetical protein